MWFDDLVIIAKVSHPIPSRTRPLNPFALMVLRLKARESKSSPDLLTILVFYSKISSLFMFVNLKSCFFTKQDFFLVFNMSSLRAKRGQGIFEFFKYIEDAWSRSCLAQGMTVIFYLNGHPSFSLRKRQGSFELDFAFFNK